MKWPSRQSSQDIINDLKNIKGFPDVIGALDETHIRITPPSLFPEQYINTKVFSSIKLELVYKTSRYHCKKKKTKRIIP